jgi:radical SAM protein with 4Fe4S-binding SPASM domain
MKRFLHELRWRLYCALRTNGFTADLGYWGAFHVLNFRQGVQYKWHKWFSKRFVTLERLWEHRQLDISAILTTGVTNICNAKCTFCAYPKVVANKTLQTGVMPFDVFKKAVDEWVALGGQSLDLTPVVGDPLVDPGVLEKVDYAVNRARLKDVVLTTNGILLDHNDTYKRLINLGIGCVFISTQGTSREVYEKVYGVKRYDEALSGIHHLLEYNRMKGEPARIVIRFRNAEKPSQILRSKDFKTHIKPYLSEKVRINFTVDFDNWGGTIQATDLSGSMRLHKLPPRLDVPCQRLFNYAVRHDGSVRLCACRLTRTDLDDLVVGNIREKSLKEISQSEPVWDIIKGFYSGKRPETCSGCTFYTPINRSWLQSRAEGRHVPASDDPAVIP